MQGQNNGSNQFVDCVIKKDHAENAWFYIWLKKFERHKVNFKEMLKKNLKISLIFFNVGTKSWLFKIYKHRYLIIYTCYVY